MLSSRPIRNDLLGWARDSQDNIVVTIPRQKGWKARLLSLIFHVPKEKKIELDEIGSQVWEMSDGQNTVEDIIEGLGQRYKLNRKESEVSLLAYLKTLGKKGLVGFMVDKPKDRRAT